MSKLRSGPLGPRRWGLRAALFLTLGAALVLLLAGSRSVPRSAAAARGSEVMASTAVQQQAAGERILVRFTSGSVRAAGVRAAGGVEERQLPGLGLTVVQAAPGESRAAVLTRLQADPRVVYAVPDYVRQTRLSPNDALYSQQWAPPLIHLPAAWDITTGSAAVKVAVIDTGIDYLHPDLSGRFTGGYDFVNQDDDALDDHGHGTHVAGIIAAGGNNGVGVAGAAWGVSLLGYKVLDASGSGFDSDVISAIIAAADAGARIINMSLGGDQASPALTDAVNYALARNVVIVAAAGNDGAATVGYPAAIPGVIAVSSTNQSDGLSSFSNYGSAISVGAPGSSILSTVPSGGCALCVGSGYRTLSGTSMATPQVAGLAALILSVNGGYSAAQVRAIIENTAADLGSPGVDPSFGNGRIDAGAAVAAAAGGAVPTATPTSTPCPARGIGEVCHGTTPTPTATATVPPPTATATAVPTTPSCTGRNCRTATPTATATATPPPTASPTPPPTATSTLPPSPTVTATATATPAPCTGRLCGGPGVTVTATPTAPCRRGCP